MVTLKRPFSPLVVTVGIVEIPVTDFKSKCLSIVQAVHDGRAREVVITKRGKPFAKLVPCMEATTTLFGFAAGRLDVTGDIFSTDDAWGAETPP